MFFVWFSKQPYHSLGARGSCGRCMLRGGGEDDAEVGGSRRLGGGSGLAVGVQPSTASPERFHHPALLTELAKLFVGLMLFSGVAKIPVLFV